MVGEVEVFARMAAALLVAFVPAAAFLGLYRLLDLMADDALIARARARTDSGSPPRPGSPTSGSDPGETTACVHCGAANVRAARYCRRCLRELPRG